MSAIGILGGMGPQASAKLYTLLIEGTRAYTLATDNDDYPEIVLLNVPVPDFISNKNKLEKAKQMLTERTKLLEFADCSVIGIACNTVHILLPELQAATEVPFLSVPDLVAKKVKESGYNWVGLLGTPITLSSTLYDDSLEGIAIVTKSESKIARQVEKYVYKQLQDDINSTDVLAFRNLVKDFKKSGNLDAVILGCTELPLVYGKSESYIIDTLQILSDGLLKEYFKPGSGSS